MTSDRHPDSLNSRISRLLELYYSGATTPAEEAELALFFTSTPDGDIPDEYAADAAMFRAMASHTIPEPPADLEARIISATCGTQRRRRPLSWLPAAAAALVLALAGGVMVIRNSSPTDVMRPQPLQKHIASAVPPTTPAPAPDTHTEPNINVAGHTATSPAPKPRHVRKNVRNHNNADEKIRHDRTEEYTYDPYIEITDPDSAAAITREVLEKLGIALGSANQAAGKADMAIAIIDHTIKNISK